MIIFHRTFQEIHKFGFDSASKQTNNQILLIKSSMYGVWLARKCSNYLYLYNKSTFALEMIVNVNKSDPLTSNQLLNSQPSNSAQPQNDQAAQCDNYITSFIITDNSVWIGTSNGYIYIYLIHRKHTVSLGSAVSLGKPANYANRAVLDSIVDNESESTLQVDSLASRRMRLLDMKSRSMTSLDKFENIISSISSSITCLFGMGINTSHHNKSGELLVYPRDNQSVDEDEKKTPRQPIVARKSIMRKSSTAQPLYARQRSNSTHNIEYKAPQRTRFEMNQQQQHQTQRQPSTNASNCTLKSQMSESSEMKPQLTHFKKTKEDEMNNLELIIEDMELISKVKLSDKSIRSLEKTKTTERNEFIISCTGNYGDDETVLLWRQNLMNVSFLFFSFFRY